MLRFKMVAIANPAIRLDCIWVHLSPMILLIPKMKRRLDLFGICIIEYRENFTVPMCRYQLGHGMVGHGGKQMVALPLALAGLNLFKDSTSTPFMHSISTSVIIRLQM